MNKISNFQILKNIISKAREEGKTLEGVFYSNLDGDDYSFCIDKLSIIANIYNKDDIKNVTYFKCTKNGKIKTYSF